MIFTALMAPISKFVKEEILPEKNQCKCDKRRCNECLQNQYIDPKKKKKISGAILTSERRAS